MNILYTYMSKEGGENDEDADDDKRISRVSRGWTRADGDT